MIFENPRSFTAKPSFILVTLALAAKKQMSHPVKKVKMAFKSSHSQSQFDIVQNLDKLTMRHSDWFHE
jgi:hypothetical protein